MAHTSGGGPNTERSMLETHEGTAQVMDWPTRKKRAEIHNHQTITVDKEREARYSRGYDLIDWSK